MPGRSAFASLAFVCLLAAPAFAASDSTSLERRVIDQDTVVVTAAKLRSRLAALATSATVIPGTALRGGPARTRR